MDLRDIKNNIYLKRKVSIYTEIYYNIFNINGNEIEFEYYRIDNNKISKREKTKCSDIYIERYVLGDSKEISESEYNMVTIV